MGKWRQIVDSFRASRSPANRGGQLGHDGQADEARVARLGRGLFAYLLEKSPLGHHETLNLIEKLNSIQESAPDCETADVLAALIGICDQLGVKPIEIECSHPSPVKLPKQDEHDLQKILRGVTDLETAQMALEALVSDARAKAERSSESFAAKKEAEIAMLKATRGCGYIEAFIYTKQMTESPTLFAGEIAPMTDQVLDTVREEMLAHIARDDRERKSSGS